MAYRQRRDDDSDQSDDEVFEKRAKLDDTEWKGMEDPATRKKRNRAVWADVALEESLTSTSSRMTLEGKHDGNSHKIVRGAETYTIPADQVFPSEKKGSLDEDEVPLEPVCTADDPFAQHVNLDDVEGFGLAPKVRKEYSDNRGRGRGRGGYVGHRGRGGTPYYRGRGGGVPDRGRGVPTANRGKRAWMDNRVKDPTVLMKKEYTVANLMNTEFPEGETLEKLGEMMAEALGETEPETVIKIVKAIGEQKALELFEETRKAEAAGGMMIASGERRRTPGGVFIIFFKSSDVDMAIKDAIFAENKEKSRKYKKAKRRGGDFSTQLKHLEELTKKVKEEEVKKEETMEDGAEGEQSQESPPPDPVNVKQETKEEAKEELDYEEDKGMEM